MATKKATIKKKGETLVLLDSHAILHRAYHALPDFASPTGEPTGALYGVVAMLLKIVEELKPDYIVACFDLPEPTYRHEAFKEYKAGRKKTDESLIQQINRSRDIFAALSIPLYEHPGFEADDMLGTIVEQTKDDKDLSVIIASGDMDTLQLVDKKKVQVYTLRKGIKDTVMYDEKTVKDRFQFGPKLVTDYKGLRGDPSDNIPGIAGIGEKTATDLIVNFGTLEKLYATLEKKTGEQKLLDAGIKQRIIGLLQDNKEEAMFSKMLATIRRDAPVDFKLPQGNWKDEVDPEAVLKLFAELGFRTLGARIKTMFDVAEEVVEAASAPEVDETELQQTAVALWLLQSDTTNPSYEDIVQYARLRDGATDFATAQKLIMADLKKSEMQSVYTDIELPLIPVLSAMRAEGILLDTGYLKKLSKKLHTELSKLEKSIHTYAGTEFNIASPKQLGEVLYDTLELKPKNQKRTATGQRSTKESELEKMIDDHPIIADILRYRELAKLLGTYIDNIPEMVGKDGRLHSTLLQTGTVTGRMASKDPNLQNIPIRSEEGRAVRGAFIAAPGYKLVSIDYSQIELRIAAILSEDPKLIEIFKSGTDVHQGVASQVFGVPETEVTKNMRRHAKVINFGILYGMGVNALRGNLGGETTRAEAQEFLNAYFNTFTRLAEYLEETKAYAREHGYTETFYGRRRYFPGIQSGAPFIRAQAERMAINAPVQGTAADVMRIAMVRVAEYISGLKQSDDARMLLQVHDELVFEVKETKLKAIIPELVSLMEDVLSVKETLGVPLKADVSVGDNWQDLTDWEG